MAALPHPRQPLPEPRPSERLVLPAGTRIWRVYRSTGAHPATWAGLRRFGPVANGRFDHHEPPPHVDPERGILYGALEPATAVVEAFGDTRLVDRHRDGPWLAAFDTVGPLNALDLRRTWPTRAGASQEIASGRRDVAQEWSRAIHAAFPDVAGLVYRSAMAGGATNVALYERATPVLPEHPVLHLPLTHPGLETALNRVAATYGYDLC